MSTHNLCFKAKKKEKMYAPVQPSFTILKWGVRGYKSHGHVILMVKVSNNQGMYNKNLKSCSQNHNGQLLKEYVLLRRGISLKSYL